MLHDARGALVFLVCGISFSKRRKFDDEKIVIFLLLYQPLKESKIYLLVKWAAERINIENFNLFSRDFENLFQSIFKFCFKLTSEYFFE